MQGRTTQVGVVWTILHSHTVSILTSPDKKLFIPVEVLDWPASRLPDRDRTCVRWAGVVPLDHGEHGGVGDSCPSTPTGSSRRSTPLPGGSTTTAFAVRRIEGGSLDVVVPRVSCQRPGTPGSGLTDGNFCTDLRRETVDTDLRSTYRVNPRGEGTRMVGRRADHRLVRLSTLCRVAAIGSR